MAAVLDKADIEHFHHCKSSIGQHCCSADTCWWLAGLVPLEDLTTEGPGSWRGQLLDRGVCVCVHSRVGEERKSSSTPWT